MDVLIQALNGQRMCMENAWLPESKGNTLAQTAAKAAKMVPLKHTGGKGNGADKCDSNTVQNFKMISFSLPALPHPLPAVVLIGWNLRDLTKFDKVRGKT